MNFRLPKNERLHSKKLIKELFDKGSSFFLYPIKVLILDAPQDVQETHQVLFSVSKKKIKKAIDRNLVKRRLKEAYRLNKSEILANIETKKLIGLIYVSPEIATFQVIEQKMKKVLYKIAETQQSSNTDS
ncbi:ribonuclease P protein component [Cecembia rubra]|uniref:Ribonuclease P protein component n=1 Tax=Cecembia rubra TaxID=1485585 RepID=A0A2P8E3D2_9BACT|nr:ribonuclease P protein component [Cecembia rubra]PSL03992.1 ribonuclease P protein component [Cecembia rubra]